jgi:hypothetical protein
MVVVAHIAFPIYGKDDANNFVVPDGLHAFLNSGLTGAVNTTTFGTLSRHIIAYRLVVFSPLLFFNMANNC